LRAGSGRNSFCPDPARKLSRIRKILKCFGIIHYMFRQFLCPSSGVFHCTHSNGICADSLRAGSGRNSFRPDPARKLSRIRKVLKFIFGIIHYMFRQFLCPSSGVFHCKHSNGICHTGLLTACEQYQEGTRSVLILNASCQHTCMKYTIAVCTVKNSR